MDLVYPNERRLFIIALVISLILWALLIVGTLGIALIYIALFLIFMIFAHSGLITYIRGNGVRITEHQYPDLYERLEHCCDTLDVETVPEFYLLRTDFFNAIATRFLRRHFVVLFSDVVDALEKRPDAINFYIGHELGHIQRNHLFWDKILAPALLLPVLGFAYRRAEEYTCDRYGAACCDNPADAAAAMAAIVAGDTRWSSLSVKNYLRQVGDTGGFWMSLNEFTSTYPWLCKRMAWVVARHNKTEPDMPRRSILAWILHLFIPSIAGGLASVIIIVAVVGILAAVAVPAYQDYVQRAAEQGLVDQEVMELMQPGAAAQQVEDFSAALNPDNLALVVDEMSILRNSVAAHHMMNGAFPTSFTEIGWETDILYSDYGGMPVSLYQDGLIGVGFGEGELGDMYLVNEPALEEGEVVWYCYGQNIPAEVLPPGCQ